jgi:hypothetical protein
MIIQPVPVFGNRSQNRHSPAAGAYPDWSLRRQHRYGGGNAFPLPDEAEVAARRYFALNGADVRLLPDALGQ